MKARLFWLALIGVIGCGDAPASTPAAVEGPAPAAVPASATAQATPRPRPLPAFDGWTLEGERFQVASLIGRRGLLFFFNPAVAEARGAGHAVASVARERHENNFAVVGVAMASKPDVARAFAGELGFDFPVVDDATGRIASRLGLRAPVALIGTDADGNVVFALAGGSPGGGDPAAVLEANLRAALRLPAPGAEGARLLATRVRAPEIQGTPIAGGDGVDLAALRGRPVVVIFFLHTCPHCHKALEFLRDELRAIPEEQRPRLIGVSVSDRAYAVQSLLHEDGLDFFPVLLDPDYAIRQAYGVVAGVPDLFVIDAEGYIAARNQGWREDRDPALLRMRLAKLSGRQPPLLLSPNGYSGNDACGVCHEAEYATWVLTRHASAFETLVRHGADGKEECVGCHVVGYGDPGGYTAMPPAPYLEDVGCESCHGRGGPHLSPPSPASYEATCKRCHDPKHSLGFDYASFLPRVSHRANAGLADLPADEKRKILAERTTRRRELLPTTAAYVGSEACRECHAAEFATWERSPHGSSLASLERKGEVRNASCLACHTTAFGRPGGFPRDGDAAALTDLARVGCESCHGPGGDHVAPDARRVGTIVSLGDKCDSCVILQICGACHDQTNDPGFEFEVEKRIEAQRHGTIEPGTGLPKDTVNRANESKLARAAVLERAFELATPDPPDAVGPAGGPPSGGRTGTGEPPNPREDDAAWTTR